MLEKDRGRFWQEGRHIARQGIAQKGRWEKGKKADLLVAETACLTLCPKGAAVAMNAPRPDAWVIVPAHTDVDEVAEAMGVQGLSKG